MHRLVLGLALILVAGCSKGDSAPTAPANGFVVFKLDASTCTFPGTVTLTFSIDGSTVGSATLATGQPSPAFTVAAGSHVLGARIANTTLAWGNISANVPSNTTFTAVLQC